MRVSSESTRVPASACPLMQVMSEGDRSMIRNSVCGSELKTNDDHTAKKNSPTGDMPIRLAMGIPRATRLIPGVSRSKVTFRDTSHRSWISLKKLQGARPARIDKEHMRAHIA